MLGSDWSPVRHVDDQLTLADVAGRVGRLEAEVVDLLLLAVELVRGEVHVPVGGVQRELVAVLPVQLQLDTVLVAYVGVDCRNLPG